MDQIPTTYEGVTRKMRQMQRKGINIGLNELIAQTITDFAQSICDEGLEGRYVTVHFADAELTITDDANDQLLTTIKAPAADDGHQSFQSAFRKDDASVMHLIENKVHEELVNHHIH